MELLPPTPPPSPPYEWQLKAHAKTLETKSKIPPAWTLTAPDIVVARQQLQSLGGNTVVESFLLKEEAEITDLESVQLQDSISEGKLSALQVTKAYCKRAAIVGQITNCLHEIFFDQAFARAHELDAFFAEHKKVVGPLHGMPVSLKDQFHVKGVDTSMGYVGWIDTHEGSLNPEKRRSVESQIVAELLALGAIVYCKTSVPQTLLLGETINNIIGRTLNPHNQLLSCGGSSGGEGALIGLRGSTLGIGTDIGGSAIIPANFCGVYAIKPSYHRFSYRKVANTNPGQTTCPSTIGFLSSSLYGLELLIKSLLSTSPWLRDPEVLPIPWRQDMIESTLRRGHGDMDMKTGYKKLKLGIYWHDGVVRPHPPVARGLRMVVEALERAGHKVIEWTPPSHHLASQIHHKIVVADGAQHLQRQLALSGEPLVPELKSAYKLQRPLDILEFQDLVLQRREYRDAYSEYWNGTADDDGQVVDAVIMPVAPHAAVMHGNYYHGYTGPVNLLNYTALALPITRANKAIDVFDTHYSPLSKVDTKNWEAYCPEAYHNAPVGVQIIGRIYEEEKLLAIAKTISAILPTT